jgi:hypothetical protein
MDLNVYSRWFDDIPIYDGYVNTYLYDGQVSSYIDSKVDGTISQRRVLSLATDLVIPPRHIISYLGEMWLVGDGVRDGIQGQAVRTSYAMRKITDTLVLRTPGEAALGLGGTTAYAQKEYLKSTVNSPTEAQYDTFWNIYTSTTETVTKGGYLVGGTTTYRVRNTYDLLNGYRVSESDQMDASTVPVLFQSSTFDPISESYSGATVATTGLLLEAYKLYEYRTQADPLVKAGDHILVVASSAASPEVGRQVEIAGTMYQIFSVTAEADSWKCLVRLA